MAAVRFKGAAGGGAPVVHQNGAALRQHGLFFVVGGHARPHPLLQTDKLGLIHLQGTAEHLGHRFLGEIVGRRAETAGGDEDVGPVFGSFQRFPQADGVVPHHCLPIDVEAVFIEAPGDHLSVGVDDLAHEQLGSHG